MRVKQLFTNIIIALALVFSATSVTSCSTSSKINLPVSDEFSFSQNVSLTLQAYGKAALEAAAIVEDPLTPSHVKSALATIVLNTEAPARAVNSSLREYTVAKAALDDAKELGEGNLLGLAATASSRLAALEDLWAQHKAALQSFPGIVQATGSTTQTLNP